MAAARSSSSGGMASRWTRGSFASAALTPVGRGGGSAGRVSRACSVPVVSDVASGHPPVVTARSRSVKRTERTPNLTGARPHQ